MIRRTVIMAACATLAIMGSATIASATSSVSQKYTGGILHWSLAEDPLDQWVADWAAGKGRGTATKSSFQSSSKHSSKSSKSLSKSRTRPKHGHRH